MNIVDSKKLKKIPEKNKTYYSSFAIFKHKNTQPFIVSVLSSEDENEIKDTLLHIKQHYKDTDIHILTTWIEKVLEEADKEKFYKRICESYVKTMLAEKIIENPCNQTVLHIFLADEAIDLNQSGKIGLNNYKNYLMDNESIYEYKSYENFYKYYVQDFIKQDIRDLGLFNGKDNEWDFYISYSDMKKLNLEEIINEELEDEIFSDSNEEEVQI